MNCYSDALHLLFSQEQQTSEVLLGRVCGELWQSTEPKRRGRSVAPMLS